MPRNIEIKARIDSVQALAQRVAEFADEGPVEIAQDDTFFHCATGRLKLRSFANGRGELIFYKRANQAGPKESSYVLSPTSTPDTLRDALTLAIGQAGRVQKHRTLFLVGRSRVHLDVVEGLGHFLELEVVLRDDERSRSASTKPISSWLGWAYLPGQLIEHAYVDMLAKAVC